MGPLMLLWIFHSLAMNYATLNEYLFGMDVAGSGRDLMWSTVPPCCLEGHKNASRYDGEYLPEIWTWSFPVTNQKFTHSTSEFGGNLFEIIKKASTWRKCDFFKYVNCVSG